MDIPKKFEINTEDFKIYFDNNKKTHVCENLETGEKTNIGFFGILLQMGIIKAIDEGTDNTMKNISEKLESLESKIETLTRRIDEISVEPERNQEPENIQEEVEETPKSDIKERIMKNVLDQSEVPTEEEAIEEKTPEEIPKSDVVVESDEEIDNWEDI